MDLLLAFAGGIAHTLLRVAPYLAGMGVLFAALSWWSPCNAGKPWWSKRGLVTDICYWMVIPVLQRYGRIGLAVAIAVFVLGIGTTDGLVKYFDHGHGPLSTLPFLAQLAIYLFVSELCLYWIHRAFHGSDTLWRFHSVHHNSEDVEWISAARFHPINILFGTVAVDVISLMSGITSDVFLVIAPFATVSSAFVHANLDWTLGPFKYVVAGPVFHRWHHTLEHGNKNFAGTFSFFDWVFGTFHMPVGELPENYGIGDQALPASFGKQILYPLTA